MKIKLNRTSIHLIIFSLMSILLLTIFALTLSNNSSIDMISVILNYYGYYLILYIVYTWKKENNCSVFCPYIIFMMFLILFNYGQPLLWALGLDCDKGMNIGKLFKGINLYISSRNLMITKLITCISIITIHTASLLYLGYSKGNKNFGIENINSLEERLNKKSMRIVGYITGLFAIPLTLYRYISFFHIAATSGYGAIYYSNDFSAASFTFIVEMFFFPSLLCILIGNDFKKSSQIFVWIIFLSYLLINLFMGDRGTWIYKLLILLWLEYNHYNIKINLIKKILIFFISILLLYFIYSAINLRDDSTITISLIFKNMFNQEFPLITAMYELGGSMNILGYLVSYGNSFWKYSNSYLIALLGLVTSRFFNLFGIDLVLIDDYFTKYIHLQYGSGFSLIGEAFMNYSSLFFIPLFLFGILFGKLFSIQKKRAINLFVVSSSVTVLTGWIRGSAYLYFKSFFYGVLLYYLAIVILTKLFIKTEKSI